MGHMSERLAWWPLPALESHTRENARTAAQAEGCGENVHVVCSVPPLEYPKMTVCKHCKAQGNLGSLYVLESTSALPHTSTAIAI